MAMNETRAEILNDTQGNKLFNGDSNYKQIIYLYILDNSVEALEHLILVALAYVLVCLGIYQVLFRRGIHRFINSVRFPHYQRVLIVTAHPDDECMFFGPTILSLTQRENCNVYLLCLSRGNFENKGESRKHELWKACKVLNLKEENITLIDATHLADDPHLNWKADLIAKFILNQVESLDIDVLITFDREGVSHHPNHNAIYYATASLCLAGLFPNNCKIYTLDSINVCRKYLSYLDLIVSLLLSTNWFILNWKQMSIVQQSMRQHTSQLVWFRKLYITFSRYMTINSLCEINLTDIELEMQINDN